MNLPYRVGDEVFDDLTGTKKKIVGIEFADGKTPRGNHMACWGIWLEGEDGGRHPWEITRDEDREIELPAIAPTECILCGNEGFSDAECPICGKPISK